jgi:hypothetical protein
MMTLEELRPFMEEIDQRIQKLLPLPSIPHDMTRADYELYIKLAEAFYPMRKLLYGSHDIRGGSEDRTPGDKGST